MKRSQGSSPKGIALADVAGVRGQFRRTGMLSSIVIPSIPPAALWQLLQAHQHDEHWIPLLEFVIASPQVDSEFVALVAECAGAAGNPQILNAIAVSQRAPDTTIEWLAREAASPSVRDHAFLNSVHRNLATMSETEMHALLMDNRHDIGVAIGVRHVLASDPRTPVSVLQVLAEDDVDSVRKRALTALSAR